MNPIDNSRRVLLGAGLAATGALLLTTAGCAQKNKEEDVGAVEDLMREHGIIRRALLVYHGAAIKLRSGAELDPQALQKTAQLFRSFGEDYHERQLEEAYIFPALKKAGGPAAAYVDVLAAQHQKGREITDYILGVVSRGAIATTDAEQLATAFDGLGLMYAHHAAREDTIVFPAWKATMSAHQLDEMGEKFEDIEKQQFGGDGFDIAVAQIAQIEQMLGLSDLAQFTPS